MKASQHVAFEGLLVLTMFVGPVAQHLTARHQELQSLGAESNGMKIELDSRQHQALLPLDLDGKRPETSRIGAVVFEVRGSQGGEPFALGLADEAQPNHEISMGVVFEYLPFGVTPHWQRVVMGIPPQALSSFKVTQLVFKRMDDTDAVLFLRNIRVIWKSPGMEDRSTIAIPLDSLGVDSINDLSLIVLDQYDDGTTKVGRIRKKPRSGRDREFASRRRTLPWGVEVLMVASFDDGHPNRLAGQFAGFHKIPSSIALDLDPSVKRGPSGKSLRVDYNQVSGGFSGLLVQFFDPRQPLIERPYLDASAFQYISLWVKGSEGGENFTVQLADEHWERREDSLPIGEVSEFLPGGMETEWREAVIPMQRLHSRLDLTRLASVVLNFRHSGRGVVYIDDISLKATANTVVPQTRPSQGPLPDRHLRRATWMWDSQKYLEDEQARTQLFPFLMGRRIDTLFVQIQWKCEKQGNIHSCRVAREDAFRQLIREAHDHGMEIWALDGQSFHVLPYWHEMVYAQVRAVLDFNVRGRPEERFDGIHHDNEPYGLQSFALSKSFKEKLLASFLDVTAGCQQLIREVQPGLAYGVDIPSWYAKLEEDGGIVGEVNWRGVSKPASFHVLDIVDSVGIMAYRTAPYGADGIIPLVIEDIHYANNLRKQVFIAIETHPLPNQRSTYFEAMPATMSPAQRAESAGQYLLVEEHEGAVILNVPRLAVQPESLPPDSPSNGRKRRLFYKVKAVDIPARRVSFANSTEGAFETAVQNVEDEFRGETSFAGVAFHDLESLRKLLTRSLRKNGQIP